MSRSRISGARLVRAEPLDMKLGLKLARPLKAQRERHDVTFLEGP
jgi:hypothetical protein